MPAVNMLSIDTEPGAQGNNPFTPPDGFEGNNKEYANYIRHCLDNTLDLSQRIIVQARIFRACQDIMTFQGPYADIAKEILRRL